jgi:hypothetical protein
MKVSVHLTPSIRPVLAVSLNVSGRVSAILARYRAPLETAQPLARFTDTERVTLRVVFSGGCRSPTPAERITGSLANIYQEHLRPGIAGDHNAIIDKLNTLTALERVSLIEWIEAP